MAYMVKRFKSHAAGQCTVSDDRDDIFVCPFQVSRSCHPHRTGERSRTVARFPDIMFAFIPLWKTAQSFMLTQGGEVLSAAGQQFMDIRLMPHIPQKLIFRAVKFFMQCNGKLDNAEIRTNVPSGFRKRFN